ncbi:MAG TPA: hypothetical protein VF771_20260 [Longimicrobiaceae bacterium]
MKKLSLDLEGLRVESFEIAKDENPAEGRGWAWSENSVCPTTAPSEYRICP